MPITNTGSIAPLLLAGISSVFQKTYAEKEPQYVRLFDARNSSRNYEEDVGLTGLGLAPIKQEGAPVQYDSETTDYIQRYVHVVYALGLAITEEALEDDQYEVLGARKAKLTAFSMRQTKEIVHANLFNRGWDSNYPIGNGQPLFSSSHPLAGGGTGRNQLSVASDLSELAIEQALIDIADIRTPRGMRIALEGVSLHIPRALQFEAKRILGSVGQYNTANNAVNALKEDGVFKQGVHVCDYFTDSNNWFIKTDCPEGGKSFQRRKLRVAIDNDFNSANLLFKTDERYSCGVTDWRGYFGSNPA
jgi:phage major head subunit gpT-like protein